MISVTIRCEVKDWNTLSSIAQDIENHIRKYDPNTCIYVLDSRIGTEMIYKSTAKQSNN